MKRALGLLVVAFTLGACMDDPPETSVGQTESERNPKTLAITAELGADGEIAVTLPDGAVARSWDEYAQLVSRRVWDFEALEIEAIVSEPSEGSLEDGAAPKELGDIGFKVGQYYVRGSWETGFIGACINRNVRHLGFMVSQLKVKQPIANLHIAAWTDGGRVCVGIYESGRSKFCWRICSPTFTQVRDGIAQGLIAVGITYATAYVIANVIAPVAFAALAL